MLKSALLVGLGGGVGSILRYLTGIAAGKLFPTKLPLGTFIVNIIGCFIVGILIGLLQKTATTDSNMRLLLIVGFCGGFTTFSAFSAESLSMIQSGNILTGILYITASIITGLLAVWIGGMIISSS